MPDPALAGNGRACPYCGGRGEVGRYSEAGLEAILPCLSCGGAGRVAIPVEKIVAAMLKEKSPDR